ncbi:hypothetical protein G7Y89_g14060 [Cudoniella acicularis]|uniref:Dihydroxyacetone kinase n=1 Tax=Cudoniella acicularis TaxID=354080 RepID=A0A8H4R8K1_9HELO|nr:hypothetical protein G7Y89_g14060 [Cudoniella acicularis]
MSSKHYFPDTAVNTLVPRFLSALVAANPSLGLIQEQRVVLNTTHKPSQVTLISGGGSGHEPAWSGYVGDGLLSAVACGDIFASPSMKQVLAAIASVPSEKAMKILGAAASKEYSFERCVEVGTAVNDQLVSIGSALDHCHVPGRQNHDEIGDDVCGAQKVSPFPSIEELISQLLTLICDQNDPERAFVKFNKGDDTVLLINNYGGLSNLELGALTQETLAQLDQKWDIKPTKIYTGPFETSLNGPGFSITLCNLTTAAKESKTSVSELMELLADETKAPSWPNVLSNTSTKATRKDLPVVDVEKQTQISPEEDIKVEPKLLEATIRLACERAIASEPNLTKWDMVMGDGDCGEAVKGVSEAILKILDKGTANSGSVFDVLHAIIDAVDDMGGTLGAIFGILLAAFATSLRSNGHKANENLMSVFAPPLTHAVGSLKHHTGARVGDRTVMDVLIPFQETLERERDLEKAVEAAEKAADGTRDLKPKFGRASYVGAGGEEQRLPDPGAWALMEMVKGIYDASAS